MKQLIRVFFITFLALTLAPACSDKKDGDGGGEAAESGPNPFQIRADAINDYMKAVEDAADVDAAVAAGQAWIDANIEDYKKNCDMLIEHRGDLEKSKKAKGIKTPLTEYMNRIQAKAGDPMKAGPLLKQLNSFFNCDNLKKK